MSAKKQEFLNGQIVLYNGDCLDVMRDLKDKEIDLVLTDPPYGIKHSTVAGKQSGQKFGNAATHKGTYAVKSWDDSSPDCVYFTELKRVSKNQIIWGANHFIEKIFNANSSCWIVWDKQNGLNNFADCELAYSSFKTAVRKFEFRWSGMLQGNMADKEQRIHPTQKPVALMAWCLNNYSQENDLIFDGFLGSGSTAIASIRTKRRLIGCELDNEYFDKMCKRIEEELRQGNLF
jgi:site-specific DNA-methyltransferase (adenine-specific)